MLRKVGAVCHDEETLGIHAAKASTEQKAPTHGQKGFCPKHIKKRVRYKAKIWKSIMTDHRSPAVRAEGGSHAVGDEARSKNQD